MTLWEALLIFFLSIGGAVWLHVWLRVRHVDRISLAFTVAGVKNGLSETRVEGTYRGLPVEVVLSTYYKAPMTITVTLVADYPIKQIHVYRDYKGRERVYEKLSGNLVLKETTSPEAMENIMKFYESNRERFRRLFEAGVTKVSVYSDRAVAACSSSFTLKRQRLILGKGKRPGTLPFILGELYGLRSR